MHRTFVFVIAAAASAALVSAGCQDKEPKASTGGRTTATISGSGTAGAGAHADHATAGVSSHATAGGINADAAVTAAAEEKAAAAAKSARAEVEASKAPGMDDVKGVVEFVPAEGGVKVVYRITGLTPNGKHGFHIHEKGDLSAPDFASAGGHFNPGGHKHGGPSGEARHGGDLGNITADDKGVAEGNVMAMGVTLDESKTGILGRSVVIHEKADDLQTDPSGNSGARVGAGAIKAAAK